MPSGTGPFFACSRLHRHRTPAHRETLPATATEAPERRTSAGARRGRRGPRSRGPPQAQADREGLSSHGPRESRGRGGRRPGTREGRGTRSSPPARDPGACAPREGWHTRPGKQCQRQGFKLQPRRSRAAPRGDHSTGRTLPRLLLRSRSARCLAVRKVTPENQGKKTAGVDGVQSVPPPQRLALGHTWSLGQAVQPGRRVWIPQPGTPEQRPLGMPVMADRALQSVVQAALAPEGEARCAPHR